MAFKTETQDKTFENVQHIDYTYTINHVREVTDTMVSFNLIINGITIYGMKLIKYTKDGQENMMIAFPSQKGKNDKYYNHVWFPMSNEVRDDIIKKVIESL